MEELIQYIQQHASVAPFIIFGALLLAGFNIPVSEDGMLFISALLAAAQPEQLIPLFSAVYAGAYVSDLICFGLGKYFGPRIWQHPFFAKISSPEKVAKLNGYYERYGAATLFLGRFIPFGVRNALFLSAGLAGMDTRRFAFFDFLACTLSCSVYFTLYYRYGETVVGYVQKSNQVIFGVALGLLLVFLVRKFWLKKKAGSSD